VSSLILGLFLTASVVLAAEGWLDITRVIQARTQLNQALTVALDSAVAAGPATPAGPGGSGPPVFVWNTPRAAQAAEQALTTVWPVRLTASGQGPGGAWATFQPAGPVPPDWAGPLTLGAFQTGDAPGTVRLGAQTDVATGPWVGATLSVPLTLRFFGVPLTVALTTARLVTVAASNGQTFVEP
jgi:hypothetical protein